MPSWVEWVGYVASLIVLISLVMSSVKRLRWINLSGSLIFAVYGILISSYPVAAMNLGIVLVNSYYLYQIYSKKDLFELIPVQDDAYFEHFIDVLDIRYGVVHYARQHRSDAVEIRQLPVFGADLLKNLTI